MKKEAILYQKLEGGKVRCKLCNHACIIPEGKRGICGVRENIGGKLYSLVYEKAISACIDPIEKKPFYHFLPGSKSFSIATIGCNFRCKHCQNWEISQAGKKDGKIIGETLKIRDIVREALATGCKSISYTYTEPTIFMEYALDTASLAKENGLRNVFVTNGYMSLEAIDLMTGLIDAANVDLKAFSDKFYREICSARLEPVLESIKYMKRKGIWIEITTLIIPTLNDSKNELREIAEFIASEVGKETPWHVTRFHPDYQLLDLPPTDFETLQMARDIGLDSGLKYVYAGNVPPGEWDNTYCPNCGYLLIERDIFTIKRNSMKDGKCPSCGYKVEGIWK